LFRRKIFSTKSFLGKTIFSKIFSMFGAYGKISTAKNGSRGPLPESGNIQLQLPNSGSTGWNLARFSGLRLYWPESDRF